MVMHARKPQRISDGYFEKHQTHPYQVVNQDSTHLKNSKYSSSKANYADRCKEDRERMRDSPNGNSYRSDSPDPHSQSPRYQNKGSFLQKARDKERENRDYRSRDKYSDCVRSPKDKRSRESRDSEHRTNHDRNSSEKVILHPIKLTSQNASRESTQRKQLHNSCQEKRDDRERERERERDRVVRVGDWSEHLSSSGKKYYYNCKTEVSQWEKPREWVDRARINYNTSTSRSGVLSPVHDKHSNSRGGRGDRDGNNRPHTGGGLGAIKGRAEAYWPSQHRSHDLLHDHDHRNSQPSATTNAYYATYNEGAGMSCFPIDSSFYSCLPNCIPNSLCVSLIVPSPVLQCYYYSGAESHSVHGGGGGAGGGGAANTEQDMEICSGESTPTESEGSYCPQQQQGQGAGGLAQEGPGPPLQLQPLKVDTTIAAADPGPPTPTHSESQDCTDARKLGSPPSSLSSLQSLTAGVSTIAALRAQGPHLTPGLANHYRDDLVNHVRGWPADVCEKQANKLSEEAHSVGSLQCTRVSAELKSFRSVVRLTEIQATLQEQRILFLRQQIKTLEELKSQNSFMANDC